MNFILIKPYGSGHFHQRADGGPTTCFKKTGGQQLDAVEGIDTTFATLDLGRTADLMFSGNTYHGIVKRTENPVTVRHVQGTASSTWNVDLTDVSPFGSEVRAGGVVPRGWPAQECVERDRLPDALRPAAAGCGGVARCR